MISLSQHLSPLGLHLGKLVHKKFRLKPSPRLWLLHDSGQLKDAKCFSHNFGVHDARVRRVANSIQPCFDIYGAFRPSVCNLVMNNAYPLLDTETEF